MAICIWCNEELKFERGRGYVHQEGGAYKMYCPACGWQGAPYPSPVVCPQCGSKEVRDDHCTLAKAE